LHIVPVSEWLADLTRQSFLKEKDIRVIRNGVDISVFKPSDKHDSSRKFRVLGVSGVWTKSKGIDDFYRLREMLDKDKFDIVLVGLNSRQLKKLPNGIIGIGHTESVQELVSIYSSSDIFFNPTYADTFPTVNIEALACGTPVLTYRTGGSPEAVSSSTGWVVGQGDIESASSIIRKEQLKNKSEQAIRRSACRERAINEFDKNKCFGDYVGMYEELIR
jgi:glycosyltransferase involved in cell wall biosynthesis